MKTISNKQTKVQNPILNTKDKGKKDRKKIPFTPTSIFKKGFVPRIAIQLAIGLMLLLFGFKPKFVRRFIYWSINLRKNNGVVFFIKYIKQARLHITRYLCGAPLYSNDVGVSLDSSGFPTQLSYFKELIDSKVPRNIRGVLTLLYFSRCLLPSKKEKEKIIPDLTQITGDYTGKDFTIPDDFIKSFVKKFKLKKDTPKWNMSDHYISSKSSPVGKATLNSGAALYLASKRDKHNHILTYLSEGLGIEKYCEIIQSYLTSIWRNPDMVIKPSFYCPVHGISGELGKLAIVSDPELKSRVIAMIDYYSQYFLKPIHNDLLNLLRHFKSDRTFTQDPHHDWKPKGNKFWSLDLSSATDRFPVILQQKLLSFIYDEDLASIWKSLLTNRDFAYEVDEGEDSIYELLRYKVGQPMGAYSSWAAFTLTHHLVVHYAAFLCGMYHFKDYIILGDDIVINNDKVAQKYKALMKRLGVNISEQKSHVSYNTYEFAKRWFKSRIEVSPLPLKGILHNYNNIPVVLLHLMTYITRCPNIHFKGNSLELISKLYHRLFIDGRIHTYYSVYRQLQVWFLLYRYSFGTLPNWELRNFLILSKVPSWLTDVREELIPSVMRELLHSGLTTIAERSSVGISDMFDNLIKHFKLTKSYSDKELEITSYRDSPLLHGLLNKLKQIKSDLEEIRSNPEWNLIEAMNKMRIESVDKIVREKRDTIQTVRGLNNLWKSSIKEVKKINEDNYYIYDIVNLSSLKGFIVLNTMPLKRFINQTEPTIDLMSNLSKGYYFEIDLESLGEQ